MLSCQEITAKANDMLDNELGFRERMAVRMHLAMCVHCRRFNRHLRALAATLKRRPDLEVLPADFVDRVMTTINSAQGASEGEQPQGSSS
ncbi:MAG: anti-sigma factor [Gammaproteobacteria bacterium]|nr:anti-sigma factor [Gammaproteobacteria bacterium]